MSGPLIRLLVFSTLAVTLFGCGAADENVPDAQIKDAVLDYYTKHPSQALLGIRPDWPSNAIGQPQKVQRYEVQNSYTRTIEGEKFRFYDVAVEVDSVYTGKAVELLPLKFVKRGNSWYWSLNTESEIQRLPEGSLSKNSRSVSTQTDSVETKSTAQNSPSGPTNSNRATPALTSTTVRQPAPETPTGPEFWARQKKLRAAGLPIYGEDGYVPGPPSTSSPEDQPHEQQKEQKRLATEKDKAVASRSKPKPPPTGLNSLNPIEFAESFYAWVIGSNEDPSAPGNVNVGLSKQDMLAGRSFFDPALLSALIADQQQERAEPGLIDAEPFTGAQDSISPNFSVGQPRTVDDSVVVPVTVSGDAMGLVLHRADGHFQVKDLMFSDRKSLKQLLDEQAKLDRRSHR